MDLDELNIAYFDGDIIELENLSIYFYNNNLSSNSTNDTKLDPFYFYEHEQLITLWILFASIILGNSLVLLALLFTKGRRSRVNYFIMHLAIADLSVGLVSVLTDIIWKLTIEWKAGIVMCKIIKYSQIVVTYSSTYVLVALSIDRYDAIRHPMNFSGSWKRAKILIASAWVISFLFSIPILVIYEEKETGGKIQCWLEFKKPYYWQIYITTVAISVFFIPTCIIATCYAVIIYTIWSKSSILTQKSKHKSDELNNQMEDIDCKRVSSRGLIPKAKIKTIKMTFVIVFVFVLCWSPYMIFDLLQVFGYVENSQSNIAIATFIQSLAPLNSAANPLIYCFFSTRLCRNLSNLPPFRCLPKCYDSSKLRGAKVTDTSSTTNISQVSTKHYINLHSISTIDKKPIRNSEEKNS